jgi:hypothetical protein
VKHGKCKLCLLDKPLCDSHLAPAGLYKYCKAAQLGPVRMTAEEISVANEEVTTYLLCEHCEQRLNRDGENWLLPKLATIEKKFPFFDMLAEVAPDTSEDGWAAYACSRNRKIGFRKLTNFAVGVFWKASVHSWRKNKGGPMIQLGKYGEEFRRFLVGKGRFPKHATLVVGVSPPESAVIGFMMPHFRGVSTCHQFVFYVPGIIFVLQVGKQISDYERQLCFYSDPLHPIIVADIAKDIYGLVGRHTAKAVRSKEVSDYLNTKRRI